VKYRLTHPSQVANVTDPVTMADGHQRSCPYCKCDHCSSKWKVKSNTDGSPGVITNWDFTKKAHCPHRKK
jgi:hypothetical protein